MIENKGFYIKERNYIIVSGVLFVFGTFLLALCYNLFFLPNNLVVGGMSGVAIILQNSFGINQQLFIYLSSLILLVISFIFLGKENTKNTIIGTILYPLFVTFTAPIAECLINYLVFQEILVTVILSSILYGISNGLIYKFGYTTGGADVLMKIICKYFHLNEGTSSFIINGIIILMAAFTFGIDLSSYAIIILVVSSIIVDKISIGISTSKKFMIYTRKVRSVKKIITKDFQTGFTIFPTIGGYSHTKGAMIMCIIRNRDVNLFKNKILEKDPNAFFVIGDCYEVQGGVKKSNLPFV